MIKILLRAAPRYRNISRHLNSLHYYDTTVQNIFFRAMISYYKKVTLSR